MPEGWFDAFESIRGSLKQRDRRGWDYMLPVRRWLLSYKKGLSLTFFGKVVNQGVFLNSQSCCDLETSINSYLREQFIFRDDSVT
jgi:hypothetical protein